MYLPNTRKIIEKHYTPRPLQVFRFTTYLFYHFRTAASLPLYRMYLFRPPGFNNIAIYLAIPALPPIRRRNFPTVIGRIQVYSIKTNHTSNSDSELRAGTQCFSKREILEFKRSSFYRQSGVATFPPLSKAFRLYLLKPYPTFNPDRI